MLLMPKLRGTKAARAHSISFFARNTSLDFPDACTGEVGRMPKHNIPLSVGSRIWHNAIVGETSQRERTRNQVHANPLTPADDKGAGTVGVAIVG